MTHRKRNLHQSKHPLKSYPFEACLSSSWKPVELIKIEAGTSTLHFVNNQNRVLKKGPVLDVRIRSRKATLSDCSCFLRPGIDVCVLSASQQDGNSGRICLEPVFLDARINSVQRKPHESECLCEYFVNLYVNQGRFDPEMRILNKEIKVVGINQISILQKLERNPCEDQHYRWDSSEDCFEAPKTKLFVGRFLSDLSWLVVASVLKQASFCVRSVENKIVYQVLGYDHYSSSLNSDSHKCVNFKVDNGMLVPIVAQVVPSESNEVGQANDAHEDEILPDSCIDGLRRSKRRNIEPERYFGYDDKLDFSCVQTRLYKSNTRKDDDKDDVDLLANCLEEDIDTCQNINKKNTCQEVRMHKRRVAGGEVKLDDVDKKGIETQLVASLPDEGDPVALDHSHLNINSTENYGHENCVLPKDNYLTHIPKPKRKIVDPWTFESCDRTSKVPDLQNSVEEIDEKYSRYYCSGTCNVQRKDLSGVEDMDTEDGWEGIYSNKEIQGKKYHSPMTRSKSRGEERTYKDRSLSADAYKELIDLYLKSTDTTPTKEPSITDQWEEFKATSNYWQKRETEADREVSEIDVLWREMEVALASSDIFDNTEGSKAGVFAETGGNSNNLCQHEFRLNEEIGIYCCKCGFVSTEIKDISPPFVQNLGWQQDEKQWNVENLESKADDNDGLHLFSDHACPDKPVSEENDIWALIPELTSKLHVHQKKAFEFLWKNIYGSVEPALRKATSKRRGGCVISHSPGAGKTFVIIAFLVSYLKLFPGKKPLVLAPKTTLYTWYKEFIKWEIPIPVYLIQSQRRACGVYKEKSMVFPGVPKPTGDVRHLLNSLEKIQKWHSHPSVLVMSYTSFFRLMGENSKFAHRKYMGEVLRKSPGVLILDEGHNPRSTESSLRRALMKVQTELRILLSGTLFQNNFCEYFNTLCLARPKFAHEVLRELDPKYKRETGRAVRKPNLIEARARKFFLDKIAKKIDSDNSDERMQGLNMLRNITNGFIDVYEGGSSDSLPGLHVYTLLMNITNYQDQIFRALNEKIANCNRYPLEVELLVTLGAIHPWLIKTAACSDKFLTEAQRSELEKCKFDLKIGPKIRFVLSLVYRVVKEEKTLIFFHYIAPMRLFVELFEKFFGWQRGREVLVLSGEQDLFERGRVMDKFEELGGASKVLLASITACAEGISLTAASRVILLDSEWNPSRTKQAIARAFRPGQQRIVYVYRLLVTSTMEEEKYKRTTWKEWVSRMIFSEALEEDRSQWKAEKIEDDILRELIEEDKSKIIHMIMKDEKASTN